ncbi:MAG: hypothetical protein ACTHON_05745 [Humibacter sp.]
MTFTLRLDAAMVLSILKRSALRRALVMIRRAVLWDDGRRVVGRHVKNERRQR